MPSIVQVEIIGVEVVEAHDECLAFFHRQGWWQFLQLFQAHSNEVVKDFPAYFNGIRAYVSDLKIKIYLHFILAASQLPLEGECWSKNVSVKSIPWKKLLANKDHENILKGIPISFLKPKWHNLLCCFYVSH